MTGIWFGHYSYKLFICILLNDEWKPKEIMKINKKKNIIPDDIRQYIRQGFEMFIKKYLYNSQQKFPIKLLNLKNTTKIAYTTYISIIHRHRHTL